MPHRSNQAVASQAQAAPQPGDTSPRAHRLLAGWATAIAALAISLGLLGLGLWLVRFSVARLFISAALAERGAEADFQVTALDFGGATLSQLRLGAENAPDAILPTVELEWGWRGVSPQLRAVRLQQPRIRLRLDSGGRVFAGALGRLGGPPSAHRPTLPQIELSITDGQALILAPFGTLSGSLQAGGAIGRDFTARAAIAPTTQARGEYALVNGRGELLVSTAPGALALRLALDADDITWGDIRLQGASLRAAGRAPLDLARLEVRAEWRLGGFASAGMRAEAANGAFTAEAQTRDESLQFSHWQGRASAEAALLALAAEELSGPRLAVNAEGDSGRGRARWSANAAHFVDATIISARPSASGQATFSLGRERAISGDMHVALAQSRLTPKAEADLRRALPTLGGSPLAPTFAAARQALGRAAGRFDIALPISLSGDGAGLRANLIAPAEARAASGARVRLAPLRQDAPALALQWPSASLHGALALELSGGGAPSAALLLDSVDWAPGAPLEADGTLTLANWRAAGASIAAEELGVSAALPPSGGGRIELRGPLAITGPLGEGQIRDVAANLDIAVTWGAGWRVASTHGCLPVRLGGLDAAGLSLGRGEFSLCPLEGALIAADARGNLSGGFRVQRLALGGRMAGPGAQPARVSGDNIVGRFHGRQGELALALEAAAPRLAIDMTPDRRFELALGRLTANARIANGWRVDGAFERGALQDPALPGTVSAIAGEWSATPENNRPIIGVSAGEALLTASPAANENERPLFNPMRIINASAELRAGNIAAEGDVLLDSGARQLAHFTAQHDVDQGAGGARIAAPNIVFGPGLQPYDITERARGMIDNVRGAASATADVAWARDHIGAVANVRLDGVSLSTATIPVVNDVRGELYFDDAFALTTPPGQSVTVGLVNPGIAVSNGRVRFQLLPAQRISIESAAFDFAGGVLAMTPRAITLGADETRIELTLRDVDAADLVRNLNIADLEVTGRVEGDFPLRLTRRSAFIENGVLRAQPGGGLLAYTGNAGAGAAGPARLAFDALKSFHYDDLALTLNGDLSGEIVSSIAFSGENTGRPVDLGPIAPVPGIGRVTVRGVPFNFHVTITAPFRRLAQTAASITNPGALLNRAEEEDAEQTVDQGGPAPR